MCGKTCQCPKCTWKGAGLESSSVSGMTPVGMHNLNRAVRSNLRGFTVINGKHYRNVDLVAALNDVTQSVIKNGTTPAIKLLCDILGGLY